MPLVLGLESSCDETGAAVVRDGREVLANVIASQHDLHAEYAGVVPEIASRAHVERIVPVMELALRDAGVQLAGIEAVAVGHRPGLVGALLVGVAAAKALSWSLGIPLIGVDHIHAHLYAPLLNRPAAGEPIYPALGLVVSGGHTTLYRVDSPIDLERLGGTIDDAVGEAFDKVATMLGLGHPGGPALERLARSGDANAHEFPVSRLAPGSLDLSFSGLKTSVLYTVRGKPAPADGGGRRRAEFERDHHDLTAAERADIAASFQRAACEAIVMRIERAIAQAPGLRSLLVGGGVSANGALRSALAAVCDRSGIALHLPAHEYCVDNAAMIAGLGDAMLARGRTADLRLAAIPTVAC